MNLKSFLRDKGMSEEDMQNQFEIPQDIDNI